MFAGKMKFRSEKVEDVGVILGCTENNAQTTVNVKNFISAGSMEFSSACNPKNGDFGALIGWKHANPKVNLENVYYQNIVNPCDGGNLPAVAKNSNPANKETNVATKTADEMLTLTAATLGFSADATFSFKDNEGEVKYYPCPTGVAPTDGTWVKGLTVGLIEPDLVIRNYEDMKAFASKVNDNKDSFVGKLVVLENDIMLESDWNAIGKFNLSSVFSGTFDGQGHTISGLYYKAAANYVAGGLFGWVSSKFPAAFKNLTLDNFYVEGEVVGGLLGRTNGQVTVDNVMLTNGTVKNAGSQTGAFIGGVFEGPAVFRYCGVENVAVCGNQYVGFFAGVAVGQEISVTDCYVKDSSATGDAEVGVLSGRMMGGSISIQNLYVIAELEATSTNIDSADFTPSAGVVYGAAANGQKPAARFVDGFFYVATVTSIIVNEDISDKGAAVTLDQISGNAAKIIMASFDYENVWKIVADSTPVIELRGDMLDDGKEDNGGDEFMDNNNDEEETKKPAKTEAPTSETTPVTTDGTTAEEKSGCGSMVGFTGLALTAMLAGAAVMLKKEN